MSSLTWLESVWQDLRYGARLLRLSPGFAFVAIVSLAMGIGANTAIFQLLDAILLRSLPVQDPQELVDVRIAGGNHGFGLNNGPYAHLTRPLWQQIRDQQEAFSGVFAWSPQGVLVGHGSEGRFTNGIRVSGDFFQVLGVQPWRGRLIEPEDEGACPRNVAVVSYNYWQREMGGRDVGVDCELMLNDQPNQVIGVTPPGFFGLAVGESFDIAQPFCQPNQELRRDLFDVGVVGRLRAGWTVERASGQLDAISPGLFEATAPAGYSAQSIDRYKSFRLAAYPAGSGVSSLRDRYDTSLWLLLGITGLVLLIACANLANLMLARASARAREISVRLALGATGGRLLRQFLAESGLLAALGAAAGIGLAQVLSRVLVWSLSTEDSTVNLPLTTDWRVLLFAAAAAALTCIVFGAAPALRTSRMQHGEAMRPAGRGVTAGRERFSMQRLMMVTQIAISLALLTAALLFVRSFRNLMTFDPGMREDSITVARLGFPSSQISPDRYGDFKRQLIEEVRNVPGVLNAATTTNVPLLGGSWTHTVHVGPAAGDSKFTWVSPGYFRTMGVALVSGRDFNENDAPATPRVAVVNQTFVRRYVAEASPVGQTLRTDAEPGYPSTIFEIVGVIQDTKYDDLRHGTPPMAFAPASQSPTERPWTAIVIHSDIAPGTAMASVRQRLAERHPEIIMGFSDFKKQIRDGFVRERLMAMLSGFFGLLAALLATVGLHGVISYTVARRRNEIGIRMALGAQRGQLVAMVMREAGGLLAVGVVIGTGLSLVGGAAASSLLFGLTPRDPLTLAAACLLLVLIGAAASFVPARRASRLEPMAALRHE